MKAVIAIDSFKGSLTSLEAGKSAADGILRVFPDAECVIRPLADGGEGMVEAFLGACGGQKRKLFVRNVPRSALRGGKRGKDSAHGV